MRMQMEGGRLLGTALLVLAVGGCAEIKSGLNEAWDEAVNRIHNASAPADARTDSAPAEKQAAATQPAAQPASSQESTAGKIKSGLNDAWDETVSRIHTATAPANSGTGSAEGGTAPGTGVVPARPAPAAGAAPKNHCSFGECKSMQPTPETVAAAAKWWRAEWAEPVPEKLKANADRLYAKGEQVFATNTPMAVKCFKAAAKSGCVQAQERMALLHYPVDDAGTPQADGVPANIVLFRKWMELAAKQGSVTACEVLGAHWYAFGNAARSHEWWEKADERGSKLAGPSLAKLDREFPDLASPATPAKNIAPEPQPEQGISRDAPSAQEAPVAPSESPAPVASSPEPVPAPPGSTVQVQGGKTLFGSCKSMEPSEEMVAEADAWWKAEWAHPASRLEVAMADKNYSKGEAMFEEDKAAAAKYFRRAAKGGNAKAQERLALLHYPSGEEGAQVEGVPANIVLYRKWMELAAEGGSVSACEALGEHGYLFGDGAQSWKWWEKARSLGSERAEEALAELQREGIEAPVPDDSAEDGAPMPQTGEAESRDGADGENIEGNQVEAEDSALPQETTGAGSGNMSQDTEEELRFGMYADRMPSEETVAAADAWWKAEWANPASRLDVSMADKNYEKGEKLFETDKQAAVKYFRRAAKGGNVKAQERMGLLHCPADEAGTAQVDGLPANMVLFLKWMELAAEKESITACEMLGRYWFVYGDAGQSREWWEKARDLGSDQAEEALAELERVR